MENPATDHQPQDIFPLTKELLKERKSFSEIVINTKVIQLADMIVNPSKFGGNTDWILYNREHFEDQLQETYDMATYILLILHVIKMKEHGKEIEDTTRIVQMFSKLVDGFLKANESAKQAYFLFPEENGESLTRVDKFNMEILNAQYEFMHNINS